MSTGRIINVAVIGGGEIAMVTHLPTLVMLSHMFSVKAIVDISQDAVNFCKQKFHIPRGYNDVGKMLADSSDVDVVLICHSDEFHYKHAIECLEGGKHLFIEKPMAQTTREADEIEAARIKSGKLVFVGHQRRFATAFLRFKELVSQIDPAEINYVRFRNFTSRVPGGIISQNGTYPGRFSDYPAQAGVQKQEFAKKQYEELTGLEWDAPVSQYIRKSKFHISPHDISLLRELFGMPLDVISAVPNERGNFLAIQFQYDGFVVALESGQDEVLKVDACVDVCSQSKRLNLRFDSPYIRGLPITLTVLSRTSDGDFSEELIRPTYESYYSIMFQELYHVLADGKDIKTTVADSREDIVINGQVLQAMAKTFERLEKAKK